MYHCCIFAHNSETSFSLQHVFLVLSTAKRITVKFVSLPLNAQKSCNVATMMIIRWRLFLLRHRNHPCYSLVGWPRRSVTVLPNPSGNHTTSPHLRWVAQDTTHPWTKIQSTTFHEKRIWSETGSLESSGQEPKMYGFGVGILFIVEISTYLIRSRR